MSTIQDQIKILDDLLAKEESKTKPCPTKIALIERDVKRLERREKRKK